MSKRKRITVTIRQELLRALDRTIDKQRIRNRSHALELILARSLDADTKQAVILASGQGVKMRPFTYEIPKPLIPVNGRPLLEHTINLLTQHDIKDIVITVSHLADKIVDHFGDGKKFGVNIKYVEEKKPSGTAGALYAARKKLAAKPFLLIYGDVLLDLEVSEFLESHKANRSAVATLALTSVPDPSAYGSVKMRGTRIVEFSEKPSVDPGVSHLVFAGCAAFDFEIFERMTKKRRPLSIEKDIFPDLISDNRMFGYPFEGQWFDVSTPEIYEQVIKEWRPV